MSQMPNVKLKPKRKVNETSAPSIDDSSKGKGRQQRSRSRSRGGRARSDLSQLTSLTLTLRKKNRRKSNMFSSILGLNTLRVKRERQEEWLVPIIDEEQSYEFRGSDLAYLWVPSTIYKFHFKNGVDVANIKAGLQQAINRFPIVAGRLRILGSHLEFDEDTQAFVSSTNLNTKHIRRIQTDGKDKKKLRLHAIVKTISSLNCGVLFQSDIVTPEVWSQYKRETFFPKVVSLSHPNKEPLIKVKVTTCIMQSLLVVEVAAVLADIPSMSEFLFFWSESCKASPNLEFLEAPELNRDFNMTTSQFVALPTEEKLTKHSHNKLEVRNIWKNMKIKTAELSPYDFKISLEYVEELEKLFNSQTQTAQSEDSDDDEFGDFVESVAPKISKYEILTAISLMLYNEFFETSAGIFCINKRGRTATTPINYFGVATSFMKFKCSTSSSSKEDILKVVQDISKEYTRCTSDKNALDAVDLEYESLFTHKNPLTKKKNIVFDARHQAPFASQFHENIPIFIGATDLENTLLDQRFGCEDELYCFELDSRRTKSASKLVRFFKFSSTEYKVMMVLDKKAEAEIDDVRVKFDFLE